MILKKKKVDQQQQFNNKGDDNNISQSSFLSHKASFFSPPSNPRTIYPWINANFNEDGYAYFISLGIDANDAIHFASTKVNALTFRKEAEKASEAFTTKPEIQNAQRNYLRQQIKALTKNGRWKDDLQFCIDNIAKTINAAKPWGADAHETKEIGPGERFVYMTAIEHAKELKKNKEEQLIRQSFYKESRQPMDFQSYGEMPPTEGDSCIIS
jgi:hypothetical protein